MPSKLKVKYHTKYPGDVYYLRFQQIGWAIVLIDERTGTIAIHSDFGDWTHSWNPQHTGRPSLKHFITDGSFEYLADKFYHGRKDGTEFDSEATIKRFREGIDEDVNGGNLSEGKANTLIDELNELDDYRDAQEFYSDMPKHLSEYLGGDAYEYFVYSHTHAHKLLQNELLPEIAEVFKRELEEVVK